MEQPIELKLCQHNTHNSDEKCPLNIKMYIHNEEEYISKWLIKYGFYEKYMTEVFLELLRMINTDNYTFIDIGSNIGYYSLIAGSMNLKTIAFEPITKNYDLLKKSTVYNNLNNITLEKYAIGDKESPVEFLVLKTNFGACTNKEKFYMNNRQLSDGEFEEIELVNIIPFDSYYKEHNIKHRMIVKIDVEEMEIEVLKGMEKTIDLVDYVFIEVSSINIDYVLEYFNRHNFQYYINIGFDADFEYENKIDLMTNHIVSKNIYKCSEIYPDGRIQYNILFMRE